MKHNPIQMVDIVTGYHRMKRAIDQAMEKVLLHGRYINGPEVRQFSNALSDYLGGPEVITCGNGTDALQAALMALGLKAGDEVIVPAFSFVSPAEVVSLLGLQPVLADVDPRTFNLDPEAVRQVISPKTRAVVPVHLFGQAAPMEEIMNIADAHQLYVVEDAAQSLGATCFINGEEKAAGTIGHIGCTSFFPSKNLGCFGDGGACITHDPELAGRIDQVVHHGAQKKYYNEVIGINSRLDTLQAAVLIEKLKNMDDFLERRRKAAETYLTELETVSFIQLPDTPEYGKHSFNQFTLKVGRGFRDNLKEWLSESGIPSMIYYPYPVHQLPAFDQLLPDNLSFPVSEHLCGEVLSLPMHTELMTSEIEYIAEQIRLFGERL